MLSAPIFNNAGVTLTVARVCNLPLLLRLLRHLQLPPSSTFPKLKLPPTLSTGAWQLLPVVKSVLFVKITAKAAQLTVFISAGLTTSLSAKFKNPMFGPILSGTAGNGRIPLSIPILRRLLFQVLLLHKTIHDHIVVIIVTHPLLIFCPLLIILFFVLLLSIKVLGTYWLPKILVFKFNHASLLS